MKDVLAFIATLLIIVAYTPYIKDISKGRTKPHPYTWFISGLITFIIFGLQYTHSAGWGAIPTFVGAIAGLVIFAFSLIHNNRAPITKSDTLFFSIAVIATLLWLIANQALLSTALISFTEILAFIPTFRKSWERPDTETLSTYFIFTLRFTLSTLALKHYSLITMLYPVTEGLSDCFFTIYLIIRRNKLS